MNKKAIFSVIDIKKSKSFNGFFLSLFLSFFTLYSAVAQEQNLAQVEDNKSNTVTNEATSKQSIEESRMRLLLLESTITGNKEQPNVLTIVPWQTAEQNAVNAKQKMQLMHFVELVDVDSLKKELEYFKKYK